MFRSAARLMVLFVRTAPTSASRVPSLKPLSEARLPELYLIKKNCPAAKPLQAMLITL